MKKTLRAIDKKRGELTVALAEVGEVARELGDAVGERASHLMVKGSEKVLERFGVPSKHDIKTLLTQVQQLTAKVERMNRGAAGRARA